MAITPIRDIRRQELLSAAYEVLKREGLQATTTDKIAHQAGASKGIVHHYFPDKRALILATLRHAHRLRKNEIVRRLRAADSPQERLAAVIDVNLGEAYLNHSFCRLWIAVAVEALNDPEYARLQYVIRRRERSTLIHALRQLLPEQQADDLLLALRSLIEACRLWVGYIGWYDSRHAMVLVYAMLRARIPGLPKHSDTP
jgi:TetR/AcrR family transcriptional repressor of bet genes